MSEKDKPLEYQRRVLDTKGVAQRVDLDYLKRPSAFRDMRRKLTRLAPLAAIAVVAPFVAGIGGGEKVFSNGPVSRAHAIFEGNCASCHTGTFTSVQDAACKNCHDGPAHPAKAIDTGKPSRELTCAQCHLEHQGRVLLRDVADGNCTTCHADLASAGSGVTIAAKEITGFAEGDHPAFSTDKLTDTRPIKLNHAVHMPVEPKTIRNMKLPMKCSECHVTDTASEQGDLLPVRFEENCRSCHRRELEFDVYQVLGANSVPAPHTRDPEAIHNFIVKAYQDALARDFSLPSRPLGREFVGGGNPAAWLEKVVRDSEAFLFDRKCTYCHEYESRNGPYPVVKPVNPVAGNYVAAKPETPGPWLQRGEFSHRSHRAVECAECHLDAAKSTKTADILIPKMQDCTACHGSSGTMLDRCSTCHLYHNKSKELDKDRRPIEQLVGRLGLFEFPMQSRRLP